MASKLPGFASLNSPGSTCLVLLFYLGFFSLILFILSLSSSLYRPHLRHSSGFICILHNSLIPIPLFPALLFFLFFLPSLISLLSTSPFKRLIHFIPFSFCSSLTSHLPPLFRFPLSRVNLLFLISALFICSPLFLCHSLLSFAPLINNPFFMSHLFIFISSSLGFLVFLGCF